MRIGNNISEREGTLVKGRRKGKGKYLFYRIVPVTSVRFSWDVGFKKPKPILLFSVVKKCEINCVQLSNTMI